MGVQMLCAQDFTIQNSVPVTRNETTVYHAWAGGYNSPQWSQADFNKD
jgi:hypothetical protein